MSAPVPDWIIPPYEGFSAEDFLAMSELPPHSELIDGSLVFVSPQAKWHTRVVNLLTRMLDDAGEPGLRADGEMMVRLGERQVLEPDVVVVTAEAFDRVEPDTYYFAEDAVLVVEAVSPESRTRDRRAKPALYAEAGIPHFWRVERDAVDGAVISTFERELATGQYLPTGIHHGRIAVDVPFPMDFGISADEIERKKRR